MARGGIWTDDWCCDNCTGRLDTAGRVTAADVRKALREHHKQSPECKVAESGAYGLAHI